MDQPWHARRVDDVEAALATGPHGLTPDDAARRLEEWGPNRLEEEPPTRSIVIFARQFRNPLIYILFVAAAVTLLLEDFVDSAVIGAVLLVNAVIGFTQERKAEQSVRALMTLVSPKAHVVRGGHEWVLDSEDLVPGDLVLLESGSRVPADLRLLSAATLVVDESLLTGESATVTKSVHPVGDGVAIGERTCMAYTGTVVMRGRARGYVVATGTATVLGSIAEQTRAARGRRTPLEERMRRLAHLIGIAVALCAAVAFAGGVAAGEEATEMFKVAVALAVAAVPEGLPIVFTIALALGVRRMARRNAIIRQLAAVETLGSTTVIGSDKTGTLTQNRMTVTELWTPTRRHTFTETPGDLRAVEVVDLPRPDGDPLLLAALAGAIANEGHLFVEDGALHTTGDPTEVALLVSATRLGLDLDAIDDTYQAVAEIPFEPERRFSASIRSFDHRLLVFAKGAPERIVEMCDTVPGNAPLDAGAVHEAARAMARRGLRVLAMAMGPVDGNVEDLVSGTRHPVGLTFLGLQGMLDPPREGVREAVAGCQRAGIRIVMITGDHALTGKAIGERLGIAAPGTEVLTGEDLDRMDDAGLARRVDEVTVYARVSPEHKLRVVAALQERGNVVAVTGDGVNDAPALRRADIGVAMGASGTDVAREAADMVLADDNFTSIHAAVEEGRVTFDNVRKVTFFLVSTGVAAVLTIFGALALGWPIPFVPAQLLWMNLVTKGLQDVALAFEPGEPGVLDHPPRRRDEGVISPLLWERTALTAFIMAAGTLALFRWELDQGGTIEAARTVALSAMVVFQAFHLGNCRSQDTSAFRIPPWSNRFLLVAQALALGISVAALYWGPTQYVLRVEPISLEAWARIAVVGSSILVAVELEKLVRRLARRAAQPTSRGSG